MLMRMLGAAGVPIASDGVREADEDNPLGYFELEAVKDNAPNPDWLPGARGKAVKVIHLLLPALPAGPHYRVIFMNRDLDEVLASQRKMLERAGRAGAALPADALKRVFAAQLESAKRWAAAQPNCRTLEVNYADVVASPRREADRIAAFIGRPERAEDMAQAVDPKLYRNRGGGPA